jgi:hypothetical protein
MNEFVYQLLLCAFTLCGGYHSGKFFVRGKYIRSALLMIATMVVIHILQ